MQLLWLWMAKDNIFITLLCFHHATNNFGEYAKPNINISIGANVLIFGYQQATFGFVED